MTQVVFTEKALRELVNEALDDATGGSLYAPPVDGVKVNAVVDPQAAESDPMNPSFKPQNATELGSAVRQLTRGMDDGKVPGVYDKFQKSLESDDPEDDAKADDVNNDEGNHQHEEDMENEQPVGTKSGTKSGTQESLRLTVRQMIREDKTLLRMLMSEEFEAYDSAAQGSDDDEDLEQPKKPAKNDESFDEIAKSLGMGVSGAKQFVDKAMARLKFLNQELPKGHSSEPGPRLGHTDPNDMSSPEYDNLNDMEILILKAWGDYIEFLQGTGTMTAGDIQLMKDHPEHALSLPGFREFAHHYIQRALVPTDEEGNEWSGNEPDEVDASGKVKVGKARTYQNAPGYRGDYDWLDDDEADQIRRKAGAKLTRSLADASDSDIEMDKYLDSYSDEPEDVAAENVSAK